MSSHKILTVFKHGKAQKPILKVPVYLCVASACRYVINECVYKLIIVYYKLLCIFRLTIILCWRSWQIRDRNVKIKTIVYCNNWNSGIIEKQTTDWFKTFKVSNKKKLFLSF